MPCYDPRDGWDSEHNNVAAQLLCHLLKTVVIDKAFWTPELKQWWADHLHRDAYYKRKEVGQK